jgi:3-oxoadipate CoA-transferase alpha subunit
MTDCCESSCNSSRKHRCPINGKEYGLEYGIKSDFSLVKCENADRYGNLVYHATARNFNPIMCTAAHETIVQARSIVDAGQIDPETVITPGIYVKKVIEINQPANESELVADKRAYPW